MSRSLTSFSISAILKATLKNTINDGATGEFDISAPHGTTYAVPTALSSGTNANQADRVWQSLERVLNSGNSENIDLYDMGSIDIGGGAGKDAAGQAMALTEICGLLVLVKSTSTGKLLIGGEGSGAAWQSIFHVSGTASDTAGFGPIGAGGLFYIFDPNDPAWAVADSTNHLLKFAATGGNVTYSPYVLGRSA